MQEAGFSHCTLRARADCEWILFADVDEFVYPAKELHDVVARSSSTQGGRKSASAPAKTPPSLDDLRGILEAQKTTILRRLIDSTLHLGLQMGKRVGEWVNSAAMEFVRSGADRDLLQLPPVLILPALSIGNAGQLATDLLISTRSVTRAGFLDDSLVLACVGNDPIGPLAVGALTVALEVFEDVGSGLAIVQQRSPVAKGMMIEYARHVAELAESMGCKEVIILSGFDSGKRDRQEMVGPQIFYVSNESDVAIYEQLGWKRLAQQKLLDQPGQVDQVQADDLAGPSDKTVPLTEETYYAGLPFSLLYTSCKARGLKVTCLLTFCGEGDNIPDAFFLADSLQQMLEKKSGNEPGETQWRIPLSWKTVYGPPLDDSIF